MSDEIIQTPEDVGQAVETVEEGATPTLGEDWRDAIAEPRVRAFAERFENAPAMARAAFELRQKVSRATPEGVPDDPTGYDISWPEDMAEMHAEADNENLGGFLQRMHAAGAPEAAVQAAMDSYFELVREGARVTAAEAERATREGEAALRREWGGDYPARVAEAGRAMRMLASGDLAAFLEKTPVGGAPLGSHPAMIRLFADLGRRLGEDRLVMGEGAEAGQPLQGEIDRITAEAMAAGTYASPAVQRRLQALYAELHGTAPIVGGGDRRL